MVISPASLASARGALQRLHTTTAQHSRPVETTTDSGDTHRDWVPLGDVACRVETSMGDRSSDLVTGPEPVDRPVYPFTVFTAHDADIRTGDHLALPSGITLSVAQASRGQSEPFIAAFACTEVA